MRLTRKKAKEVSIEVWQYLYDHPEIEYKDDLPKNIYEKISISDTECLLCDLYNDLHNDIMLLHNDIMILDYITSSNCKGCPLQCCEYPLDKGIYSKWRLAETSKTRKKYAGIILEKIKNWDISKKKRY
jgi:hypothetical protein